MKCFPKTIGILMFHSRLHSALFLYSRIEIFSPCVQYHDNNGLIYSLAGLPYRLDSRLNVAVCVTRIRRKIWRWIFTDELSNLCLNCLKSRTELLTWLNSDIVAYWLPHSGCSCHILSASFHFTGVYNKQQLWVNIPASQSAEYPLIPRPVPPPTCAKVHKTTRTKKEANTQKLCMRDAKKTKKKTVTIEVKIT